MIPASPDIGIGIATKNRWDDLAVTLTHLREEGLDKLETLVIDDGSDKPMPDDFRTRFPWVKFERFEKSEGYIRQRNRLGRSLTTPFYLSLDDDSFPVAGDLAAAAEWLKANPEAAALAFRIIFSGEEVPGQTADLKAALVKDFIGCAFMLRRELFLSLGGFEERLYFYHEEPEYCFRTFQRNFDTYLYPVVVRHMVTRAGRDLGSRTRFFIRNVILLDLWFYPFPSSLARAVGHLPLLYRGVPQLRRHKWLLLCGWAEGFVCYGKWGKLKQRLTRLQLAEWNSRPGALQAMGANLKV